MPVGLLEYRIESNVAIHDLGDQLCIPEPDRDLDRVRRPRMFDGIRKCLANSDAETFDPALMDPVLQTAYRGGLIKAPVSGKELAYPGF